GIAKGFAVDRAVEALQSAGIPAGVVNAGGDLRLFGEVGEDVYVRPPQCPDRLIYIGQVKNAAVATSAALLLVDPRRGRRAPRAARALRLAGLRQPALRRGAARGLAMARRQWLRAVLLRKRAAARLCFADPLLDRRRAGRDVRLTPASDGLAARCGRRRSQALEHAHRRTRTRRAPAASQLSKLAGSPASIGGMRLAAERVRQICTP